MSFPTDSTFRKIDLQASADLTFLAQKLLERVDERVNEALPLPSSSAAKRKGDSDPDHDTNDENNGAVDDDPVRSQVRKLMHEWVAQVYRLSGSSLAINGTDVTESTVRAVIGDDGVLHLERVVEEYEPIDAKLAMHLRKLEAQKDSLTEKVADLRRLAPLTARDRWLTEQEAADGVIQIALAPQTTTSSTVPSLPDNNPITTPALDQQLKAISGHSSSSFSASLRRSEQSWITATNTIVELQKLLAEDLAKAKRATEVVTMVQARSVAGKKTA